MKKMAVFFFVSFSVIGCNQGPQVPDVSDIVVNTKIDRFDKAFFSIDSNQVEAGLYRLNHQFPYFTNDFTANILGAGPLTDTNKTVVLAARQFLTSYRQVKDSLEQQYEKLDWLEIELKKSFQLVKYYFPKYPLPPKYVSFIGPFDAPGVAITRYTLAIGLQLYAGRNFSFYTSMQGQELYPSFISRRFERPYMVVNCMKAISEDLFPDNSSNKPLVEQMIVKGKYWWLEDRFLPSTADSLKTGFTKKQLEWCMANEGLIWNFLLQNTDIFTIDPDLIKNYIGDAPGTNGMPDIAPGNIGQWVGWRIVKKYSEKNPSVTPDELMRTDARKIFEEAKYKPK